MVRAFDGGQLRLRHPDPLFDHDLALASIDHGSPHAIVRGVPVADAGRPAGPASRHSGTSPIAFFRLSKGLAPEPCAGAIVFTSRLFMVMMR
jgi:hypothetical protein